MFKNVSGRHLLATNVNNNKKENAIICKAHIALDMFKNVVFDPKTFWSKDAINCLCIVLLYANHCCGGFTEQNAVGVLTSSNSTTRPSECYSR